MNKTGLFSFSHQTCFNNNNNYNNYNNTNNNNKCRLCLLTGCVSCFEMIEGCSGLTGTSLVTPTGETRTNSQISALRGLKLKQGRCSHSRIIWKQRLTQRFCATPRTFCIFMHPHFLFFFRAAKRHTDRLLDKERVRCVSPGRAVFRCARHASTWTSVCVFSFSLSLSLFVVFFFFLGQEKTAAEIKQELCRIRCIWLEEKKKKKKQASAMQILHICTKCVWLLEKMLKLFPWNINLTWSTHAALITWLWKEKHSSNRGNIFKCTLSHIILELKSLFALMANCMMLNNPDDMHRLIHCFLYSHQSRWY